MSGRSGGTAGYRRNAGRGRGKKRLSRRKMRKMPGFLAAVVILGIFLAVKDPHRQLFFPEGWEGWSTGGEWTGEASLSSDEIPQYDGVPYVTVDGNEPEFQELDMTTSSFEEYSPLDDLGRCGTAFANVGQDLMPDGERESISQVKPTGWQTATYDIVDGEYLYNRCHLIGYQLTGENANERNLITGTRYMNVEGMLPFENLVADYVQDTGGHVLYRVTPVFPGRTWWRTVWRWRDIRWKMRERASASTCSSTMYSRESPLTIQTETAIWPDKKGAAAMIRSGFLFHMKLRSL